MRDKVSEANQAVIDIRALRQQINDRLTKVSARRKSEIQKLADAVLVPLTAVEEEAYQVRNRSGQDPLNFPIRLNNKLAALMGVVSRSETPPNEQSIAVYNELTGLIDAQLQKLSAIMKTDVPAFNQLVKDQSIPAIVVKP